MDRNLPVARRAARARTLVKRPERQHCPLDSHAGMLAGRIRRCPGFQLLAIAALPVGVGESHGQGLAAARALRNPVPMRYVTILNVIWLWPHVLRPKAGLTCVNSPHARNC